MRHAHPAMRNRDHIGGTIGPLVLTGCWAYSFAMDATGEIFADDFAFEPYWWMAAPRPKETLSPVPEKADAVIVGSGFTGLSAALTLARAGRDVVILEAGPLGHGASTRNAGFVGKTLKHSFSHLLETKGEDYAVAVYREMQAAFDCVTGLIEHEQITCHYRQCGRYMAANSPAHYEVMARELDLKRKHLGEDSEMVSRANQDRSLGSDIYHGGAIVPGVGSLHPALYQAGLLERVVSAGVAVLDHTPFVTMRRDGAEIEAVTARGSIRTRDLLIATNGYTRRATPWLQRRVVPFRGLMIATEELPPEKLDRILPQDRTVHDFNNNLIYLRRAPDSSRLLFGGRTGFMSDDGAKIARLLHARMCKALPEMDGVRISRAWNGFGAGTFDLYPHLGSHDGMHYALGYCFAGVPMGTYLGRKMALRVLEEKDADTIFADRPFPGKWWYRGNPWFLPLVTANYDRLDARGS